ncbi:VF530 family DNA-binding protein [Butyricimonas sp. BSD2780061689_150309_C8]|uniref:VF530 family DNA-binding protein n=1 Tax=Butyricimonas sp. BSD2780061689_150309_C8 TaxID=2787088 RepID=UPI00189CC2F6|nr:VF530 family DNA-binding protein [Butyricimonas sp. BSD2780061689_150309_C8]
MKFVVLMVLLPVITFAIPAYSQKQIKMDVQGVSLEQVLKELQVQSGYYILYNKQDVQGVIIQTKILSQLDFLLY